MRIIEGVTAEVNAKMHAVSATILCEDGLLLRVCDHGIRHPVGNIHTADITAHEQATRHEVRTDWGIRQRAACDACCLAWRLETGTVVDGLTARVTLDRG